MSAASSDRPDAEGADWALFFGGPDKPPRRLRDLLAAMVDAQGPGEEITWATYYFRDRDLAARLCAASDRGVRVKLVVEGRPRRRGANDVVIAMLRAHGLDGGLCLRRPKGPLRRQAGRLHAKIYAFSHPRPAAFIGSFNPSGNEPEDPDIIAEIGDQDRGHNLLLQLFDPVLVARLQDQAGAVAGGGPTLRFSPRQNAPAESGPHALYFYPRIWPHVAPRALHALPEDAAVTAAVSHLKPGPLTKALSRPRRGAVRLLVHDTERRAPQAMVDALFKSGVSVSRYVHTAGLPMHAKFILTETAGGKTTWLGSYNHNPKSAWLNHEVLMRSEDPLLHDALERRFETIAAQSAEPQRL